MNDLDGGNSIVKINGVKKLEAEGGSGGGKVNTGGAKSGDWSIGGNINSSSKKVDFSNKKGGNGGNGKASLENKIIKNKAESYKK